MKPLYYFSLVLCLSVFFMNCKDSNNYTPVNKKKQKSMAELHKSHKVTAKEYKDAGIYTYVKVAENDDEFWIAIPKKKVEIGATYYYIGGTKMLNFKSKELNRTFDMVFFVDSLSNQDFFDNSKSAIKIIEQPQGAIAVNKILEDPKDYKGKTIMVKGKVVKVNMRILDRNWVHISDGTVYNDKQNLTFTTQDTVKLGDVVTLKGVLTVDKDFGYGYVYPILVENSEVLEFASVD